MNENVHQLIADAIKVIEAKGWTQNVLVDHKAESVCTLGALDVATRMAILRNPTENWRMVESKAQSLVAKELNKLLPLATTNSAFSIPDFNDAPETTKEDILLGLKHALIRSEWEEEEEVKE